MKNEKKYVRSTRAPNSSPFLTRFENMIADFFKGLFALKKRPLSLLAGGILIFYILKFLWRDGMGAFLLLAIPVLLIVFFVWCTRLLLRKPKKSRDGHESPPEDVMDKIGRWMGASICLILILILLAGVLLIGAFMSAMSKPW